MSTGVRLELAFLVACGTTLLATPLAISAARRTGFYDHPGGYKGHLRPTPYLGGTAVLAGLLASGALFAGGADEFLPIAIGALVLLALGTIDDRYGLGPLSRLAVEVGVASGLYAAGIRWFIFPGDALNFAFTVIFVTGIVNAYNLMDNMDGAAGAVAAVAGAGLGVLAVLQGDAALAAIGLGLAGACAGFLPFNLASPSRIFLGDGGSMPVGFTLAAMIMAMSNADPTDLAFVPVTVVLVGLPALDTALVVVSRLRRGVGVFSGGRDHLTHRLRRRLGSARRVALALAAAQALLCGVGIALFRIEDASGFVGASAMILAGIFCVALLESAGWAQAASEPSA